MPFHFAVGPITNIHKKSGTAMHDYMKNQDVRIDIRHTAECHA